MFRKSTYCIVNVMVLSIALGIFVYEFFSIRQIRSDLSQMYMLYVLFTVLMVYSVKCIRLYLVIYGYGSVLSRKNHLRQFVKTVPVNILLPLKTGDIFRCYCYGYALGSFMNSLIFILLDRFSDTLALITLIILVNVVTGNSFSMVFYLLLIFVVSVIVVYFIFPPVYDYWNRFFIEREASASRLRLLGSLEKMNDVYAKLKDIVQSRGAALYFLSLTAWIMEGTGFYFISSAYRREITALDLEYYLESALGLSSSDFQRTFVFVSAVVSLSVYVLLVLSRWMKRRR